MRIDAVPEKVKEGTSEERKKRMKRSESSEICIDVGTSEVFNGPSLKYLLKKEQEGHEKKECLTSETR